MRVQWRGFTFDARTRDMLLEVQSLVGPDLPVHPAQGSYSDGKASAATHSGGGAVDLSVLHPRPLSGAEIDELVHAMRTVGFAAWYRARPEWSGDRHIHGIAVDAPDLSEAAAAQVGDLVRGRNGLASHGPDRHADMGLPVTTWEAYCSRRDNEEDDVTKDDIAAIAQAVLDAKVVRNQTVADAAAPGAHFTIPQALSWAEERTERLEGALADVNRKLDALLVHVQDRT